jgi:hypothetical protein
VLEQQQEMLPIQQCALLDATSGAGGQQQQEGQQKLQQQQQAQQPLPASATSAAAASAAAASSQPVVPDTISSSSHASSSSSSSSSGRITYDAATCSIDCLHGLQEQLNLTQCFGLLKDDGVIPDELILQLQRFYRAYAYLPQAYSAGSNGKPEGST